MQETDPESYLEDPGESDSDDAFDELLKEASRVPERAVHAPGSLVGGRYRLDRLLGEGGMGIVWAATHEVTRRAVALKLMQGHKSVRAEHRERFLLEARTASAVVHPNVVPIRDVFELEGGELVMVMDLLEGETLRAKLDRIGPLTLKDAATILLPVVSAVGTAHAQGVVHRDLKPENIFLAEPNERVCVLDFGLAKILPDSLGLTAGELTRTGERLGTPAYMAPEQVFGESDVDQRVDVWAIGTIIFECVVGARPHAAVGLGQVARELNEEVPPVSVTRPELDPALAELLDGMLARDRYERLDDLRSAFELLARYAEKGAPPFDDPDVVPAALADTCPDPGPGSPAAGAGGERPAPRGASSRRIVTGLGLALAVGAALVGVRHFSDRSGSAPELAGKPDVERSSSALSTKDRVRENTAVDDSSAPSPQVHPKGAVEEKTKRPRPIDAPRGPAGARVLGKATPSVTRVAPSASVEPASAPPGAPEKPVSDDQSGLIQALPF